MSATVKFNFENLAKELKKKNVGISQASKTIGYSRNYLGATKVTGRISIPAVMLIDKLYGIKSDKYIIPEGVQEELKEEPKEEKNYDKLYEVIYTAVYQACKKACEDAWENV